MVEGLSWGPHPSPLVTHYLLKEKRQGFLQCVGHEFQQLVWQQGGGSRGGMMGRNTWGVLKACAGIGKPSTAGENCPRQDSRKATIATFSFPSILSFFLPPPPTSMCVCVVFFSSDFLHYVLIFI